MVLLTIVAFPSEDVSRKENVGGAYVNCWINTDDTEFAEKEARRLIEENKWRAHKIENVSIYDAPEDLAEGQLEFYNEALKDGSCMVYHTWPREDRSPST